MDDAPSTAHRSRSPQPFSSLMTWLAACLLATGALAITAAYAPPRIRLIGLYSIAFGLLVGWLLVRLAEKLDVTPSRWTMMIVAAMLTLGGLALSTWETCRIELKSASQFAKESLEARLIQKMKTQNINENDVIQIERSPLFDFRRHLVRRISPLGKWTIPWAELFWCGELIAAMASSIWVSSHTLQPVRNTTSFPPSEPS